MMTNEQWAEQAEHDFATDMVDARADMHAEEVESLRVTVESNGDPIGEALDEFDKMTDEEKWDTYRSDCDPFDWDDIYGLI